MVLVARNNGKEVIVSTHVEVDHFATEAECEYAIQILGQGFRFFIISEDEV